jgi:[ribosomal protein S5]-alanine N-acetyltransferase
VTDDHLPSVAHPPPAPPVQPTLAGARLDLRPFSMSDAPAVQLLAGAREVAASTLTIPHPYPDGEAERWIGTHARAYEEGSHASFAVIERATDGLVGAAGLAISAQHGRAELGYWIGVPFWNQGYATEAAGLVVDFGFEGLRLNRIFAHHFVRNPASGRVMQKIGMRHEGRLRQHIRRWGRFEDVDEYGVLAGEWGRPAAAAR